jgi:hypothetical protein
MTEHLPDIEKVSELVHADWVKKKLAAGVKSRKSTWARNWCARTTVQVVYKAIRDVASVG